MNASVRFRCEKAILVCPGLFVGCLDARSGLLWIDSASWDASLGLKRCETSS